MTDSPKKEGCEYERGNDVRNIRGLGKDLIVLIPGRIVPAFVNLIAVRLYTDYFNASQYGIYSIVTIYISAFATIVMGWIAHGILRYYPASSDEASERRGKLFSTVFYSWLATSALSLPVMFVLRNSLDYFELRLEILTFISFWSFACNTILISLLRSARSTVFLSLTQITYSICKLLISVLLVKKLGFGVDGILFGGILSDVVFIAASMIKIRAIQMIRFHDFSFPLLKRFLIYGLPIVGVASMDWVLAFSDRLIISHYRGLAEVGIYSVGYNAASQIIGIISGLLMFAVFPVVVQTWHNQGKEAVSRLLSVCIRYYVIIMVPVVAFGSVFAKDILSILANKQYADSASVVPWVILGCFFMGLGMYANKPWELTERTWVIFLIMAVSAIFNVVLNIIFVPIYGYIAAAIDTAVAYVSYTLISGVLGRKILAVRIDVIKIAIGLLSGAILTVIMAYLENRIHSPLVTILGLCPIACFLYIFIVLACGVIRLEELGLTNPLVSRQKK